MDAINDRPRTIVGFALLVLGALFLLSNIGILRGLNAWAVLWGFFWLWLGSAVIGPRGRGDGSGRKALGLIFIVIGAVTLSDGLGVLPLSSGYLIGQFWPIILIVLGLMIFVEANRRSAGPAASNRIAYDAIFGDFRLTQPGWQLRDVQASVVIGDMKIDLARALIPDGETAIDLRAVIGDIDVWLPPDLPIALDVQCAFVTVNHLGRRQDVMLRRYVETPEGFDLAPRRVRVHANLVFGDLNLTRAG